LDEGPAAEAFGSSLDAQECESQVDSFDFAEPILALGVLAALSRFDAQRLAATTANTAR